MAELKNINDYLAGDVNLKDIDYIVVKAGDANFFQVTGGAHFFGVDGDNNSIYNLWLDANGKFVSEDANGHKDIVAYIDNNKLQVVYGRHTDPYNGLSQPVTVTLDGTEDKGKSLLNAFKGYADTWFNNLFVPRVEDISVEVAVGSGEKLVTAISLDKQSISGKVGDIIDVAPYVTPADADNKLLSISSPVDANGKNYYTVEPAFTIDGNSSFKVKLEVPTPDGETVYLVASSVDNGEDKAVKVSIPVTITAA